jgi:exopolysaccharide production protein ExoY
MARVVELEIPAPVGGSLKRVFDICFAAAGIVLLMPLMLGVAAAIRLSDGGPALYRHRRIGRNGRPFDCLKFRTMVTEADEALASYLADNPSAAREWASKRKLTNDPRVTSLGAVLRKSSVDELPQLINILKGDMSIVGPRPIVSGEIKKYGLQISEYYSTRPGLTGLWQVSGRNDIDYNDRVALDCEYIRNWSIGKDFVIILRTVPIVLQSRGCY